MIRFPGGGFVVQERTGGRQRDHSFHGDPLLISRLFRSRPGPAFGLAVWVAFQLLAGGGALAARSCQESSGEQVGPSPATSDPAAAVVDPAPGGQEPAVPASEAPESRAEPVPEPSAQPAEVEEPARWFTLGSLSADGKDRFLATFCSRGGTLERLELNARDRKGAYRYRDLEHAGGYAGSLELTPGEGGLQVNVVGRGTPAGLAGVLPGDTLVAMNGEPVGSIADFQAVLARSRIGDTVNFSLRRGEAQESVQAPVVLTEQPIALLRPDLDEAGGKRLAQPSLLCALMVPGEVGQLWPKIDPAMALGNWEGKETTVDGQPAIEFTWRISDELATAAGRKGPLEVVRTFWLEPVAETSSGASTSRDHHVNFRLEIRSGSEEPESIAWELDGPTGLTTEGWWYQNKIHGRSNAFFQVAGTRDVVGSTSEFSYRFFGGPEIVSNALKNSGVYQSLVPFPDSANSGRPTVHYLGVDAQYFNVSLIPAPAAAFTCQSAVAAVMSYDIPKNAKLRRLTDCSFILIRQDQVSRGQPVVQDFELFVGPKEKALLQAYGLEDNRTFGWFAWVSKPLCWLLSFFYWSTGSISYGIAIVMLTVLVRLCVLPISRKAALNAQMMQLLGPEMKAIAERFKDDMDGRARAQRELFARHKYNPFGGCFLMFAQLPIFIGLYRGLSVDIALRDKPLIPGMGWCSNLAGPDRLSDWESWMPAWLADETGWFGPYFNVLPLVTIVLFLVQQKLFMPPPTDDQQKMMQRMMTWMMVFMGVMFFKVPSGLCIYFITSSLWGMAERQLLPKPQISQEKVDAIKGAIAAPVTPSETSAEAQPQRSGLRSALMKRLRDQIEYGEQRPDEPVMDAETRKRLDRERAKRRRNEG